MAAMVGRVASLASLGLGSTSKTAALPPSCHVPFIYCIEHLFDPDEPQVPAPHRHDLE
jgi:hypothetical protein